MGRRILAGPSAPDRSPADLSLHPKADSSATGSVFRPTLPSSAYRGEGGKRAFEKPIPDHVAYRGLAAMSDLPPRWRAAEVTAWLGPRMHAVTYPVQGGRALNIVCVVDEALPGDRTGWDHPAAADRARSALAGSCLPLQELVRAVAAWGLWVLHDRPPMASTREMAQGRVALAGDAAHPMRPYLAQGAAMALEEAHQLGRLLAGIDGVSADVPSALSRYALARWERCARVQRRSLRNGKIFHATGALRLARDAAMRLGGGRVMDVPWLYGG